MRWRQRTLSWRRPANELAVAAPLRPFFTGDDETLEQEEPEGKRQRAVAGLLCVFSLVPLLDEIPVSFVATHEMDKRPVYDHKTGERVAPNLVEGWSMDLVRGNDRTFNCSNVSPIELGSRQDCQMSMAGRD